MSEEWGPWVTNPGYMPVRGGTMVKIEIREPDLWGPSDRVTPVGNPDCDRADVWSWQSTGSPDDIIRYRVRKPRGLVILEKLIEEPVLTDA